MSENNNNSNLNIINNNNNSDSTAAITTNLINKLENTNNTNNNTNGSSTKDINEACSIIQDNTQNEMEVVKMHRDYTTRMHKDPYVEAKLYLAKNDVYELFKV